MTNGFVIANEEPIIIINIEQHQHTISLFL